MKTDTIAAIATGMTNSGIGIVRVSGEDAISIVNKIYRSRNGKKKLSDVKSHTIHYGFIYDGDELIDEVMVSVMKAPNSFTAEDTVEINCHGGVLVMNKILETVIKYGARTAEAGEFTKRAFLNGRIDLAKAEAVMDIIHSKSEFALKSSVNQLKGSVSKEIKDIREKIIYEIAFIESALEIFKRYNSGITPLKTIEIDKAIYFEDDLNSFFKCMLQNEYFYNLFTNIFKYEDVKVGIALKKIRQLLVLHKIPIKYYSISKQKITDKYYDLLSSQITPDKFTEVFKSFKQKLELIENIRISIELNNIPFNRLISEVLFWAFSILEDNGVDLSKIEDNALKEMELHLINNLSVFKMDRSSFANEIVTRFSILADYLQKTYNINRSLYIETGSPCRNGSYS